MRDRVKRPAAIGVIALLLSLPSAPVLQAKESFGVKVLKAAGTSAASKGAEFAVKFVGGLIYNTACKEKPLDETARFLCDVVGNVSGKSDEEWKKRVDESLQKINGQLGVLVDGQKQIQNALARQHRAMEDNFKQVAANVEATRVLVRVETLWDRYVAQLQSAESLDRRDLLDFAKDVALSGDGSLHTKLGDLNTVLTKPVLDSQSLLKFPFFVWKREHSTAAPPEAFDATEAYDFAEKKFVALRMAQQKGYLLYLWAAEILESDCEMNAAGCRRPPVTSKRFAADFERYTRQQVEAFNAALDSFLLAYGQPRYDRPMFLPHLADEILLRANFLAASILGDGEGAWGRVVSMGRLWNGKVDLSCGGKKETLAPVLEYQAPVDDPRGPMDWWASRGRNGTYDEVRFASDWRVLHYHLPKATPGSCRLEPTLPGSGGVLPWSEDDSEVVTVTKDGKSFAFGSFLGIQRAGGSWALASGQTWDGSTAPETIDKGDAVRKETRFDWTIDTRRAGLPWVSLINVGRGEFKVPFGGDRMVRIFNKIHIHGKKEIYFPDDRSVRLRVVQHPDCAKVCRGVDSVERAFLDYDVENDAATDGYFSAKAAIFLHPRTDSPLSADGDPVEPARNGLFFDGSYSKVRSRQAKRFADEAEGAVKTEAGKGYRLQYLLNFGLTTYTRGADASSYFFRGKLTPSVLYLTK